ncbi:MAG: hypothetical protein OXG27_15595, partial [Chloroflexi bacterium]|nr:hypothetical protein [Chloroflexota bacterium]
DLSAVGIDTYLYLRQGSGQRSGAKLHEDDDSGTRSNARISRPLPRGDYTIEATTYRAYRVGPFTLSVSGLATGATGTGPQISVVAGADITEGGAASFTINATPAPTAALNVP